MEPASGSSRAVVLGRTSFRHVEVEAIEVASAPGVWVPAWLFLPKKPDPSKSLLIVLEPGGRAHWHEGELYDQLGTAGFAVCAPDLRGMGDLTPEFSRGAARHAREHNNDEHWAWASLILGKPLAGQRATDLATLAACLLARPELAGRRVVVAAQGALTVPALFAAVLEPLISGLYLSGGLVSFRNLADTEDYRHPFGNFVPRLLNHTDLPRLAAQLAPRRVIVAGAVDAAGRRMDLAAVKQIYAGAANAEVRAEPGWSAEGIMAAGGPAQA
jgi:hypothetical protein